MSEGAPDVGRLAAENAALRRRVAELEETAARYRLLTQNAKDTIWAMEFDGTFTYHSPSVLETRGFTPDEANAIPMNRWMTAESVALVERVFEEESRKPDAQRWTDRVLELEVYCKDGSTVWVEEFVRAVRDAEGRPVSLQGTSRDISARKQAEEALRRSERRFRALVERSGEALVLASADGTILYESPNVPTITGYDIARRLGRGVFETLHPDDSPAVMSAFGRLVSAGEAAVGHVVFRAIRPDGEVWWAEATGVNLLHDPSVQAIVVNYRDVTAREKAVRALSEAHELLQTVFESSPIGLEIYDKNAVLIQANRTVAEMFGADIEAAIGTYSLKNDPNYQFPDVWERLGRGEIVQHETTYDPALAPYTTTNRGKSHHAVITTPIPDTVSDRVGYIMQIIDITERKRLEAEQEKLQAQLLQAQKMEAVGRLAGGVAHDFNNMLGVILGNAELALEGLAPGHQACVELTEIQKAAERSADLTRQLLAFARKQTIAPKVLDLERDGRRACSGCCGG